MRLGLDRAVIDAPWGLGAYAIANIWRDPATGGGWERAWWPRSSCGPAVVAPLDLQIGHVLEVHGDHGRLAYGWIADVDEAAWIRPRPMSGRAASAVSPKARPNPSLMSSRNPATEYDAIPAT